MTYVINPPMAADVRCRFGKSEPTERSTRARIAAFLDGESNGEALLHALYDHVLREPIPKRMREVLKGPQVQAR
jgi:hypothetical protein